MDVVAMDKCPCHCNYDASCCGIFNELRDGEMICNECGMTINELLELLVGRI